MVDKGAETSTGGTQHVLQDDSAVEDSGAGAAAQEHVLLRDSGDRTAGVDTEHEVGSVSFEASPCAHAQTGVQEALHDSLVEPASEPCGTPCAHALAPCIHVLAP